MNMTFSVLVLINSLVTVANYQRIDSILSIHHALSPDCREGCDILLFGEEKTEPILEGREGEPGLPKSPADVDLALTSVDPGVAHF